MKRQYSQTVYSTDPDWKPDEQKLPEDLPQKQGTVYLRRESKGRGGKTVTVVTGLTGNLKQWKKDLQKLCGSGGTVKAETIEIQGDHRRKIAEYLNAKGIKSKMAGG